MANDFTSHFHFGDSDSASPIEPESPFRVLVIGTFAAPQSTTPLAESRPRRIDIDNFDTVLEKFRPSIRIPLGDHPEEFAEVSISQWDDFHPDQLFDRLPLFQRLRSLRSRLQQNDASFDKAAAEVQELIRSTTPDESVPIEPPAKPTGEQSTKPSLQTESDSDLLERVLGKPVAEPQTSAADQALSAVDRLVRQVIAPHIEPKSDPRKQDYVEALDQAIAEHMRALLHDPRFQSLESNWIGLKRLVDQSTGTGDVQVFVLNTDKRQLSAADGNAWQNLKHHESWSLILSTETFNRSADDVALLSTLGHVAASRKAPLIACASPKLLGCQSWHDGGIGQQNDDETDTDAYSVIRRNPIAESIALIGPRYLSRMPYGQATDPIDSFKFEEIVDPTQDHDSFLWGPSSLLAGALIAESFLQSGWSFSAEDRLQCDDLPAFTFKVDDEVQLMPCAETYLSERDAEAILSAGMMPLVSIKHQNAARVLRFQSIHQPATRLAFS